MIFAKEQLVDLEDAWNGILFDRIPHRWKLYAYQTGTRSLAYFLDNLKQRFAFILKWGD